MSAKSSKILEVRALYPLCSVNSSVCFANSFVFCLFGVYYLLSCYHHCEHCVKIFIISFVSSKFSQIGFSVVLSQFVSQMALKSLCELPHIDALYLQMFIRNCNATNTFVSWKGSTQCSETTTSKYYCCEFWNIFFQFTGNHIFELSAV